VSTYFRTIHFDEEKGPHIVFADPEQCIYLSDMNGDGLTDIVRIRNGEVCYWPNLGYGKFGAKIGMDNSPIFDYPDSFNPSYIRLADIDGSGTTDIIYLGKNNFTCWMNLSGNSFHSIPFAIEPFPEIHNQSKITVTDLLGDGVACIVWSSSLEIDAQMPLKYIDLMNSKKPHIMISYRNNLGKEVYLEYTASTKFYIEDKLAGNPWITKLHFPVHCISKTETRDMVSGFRFVSSYKYHHGYYDHPEREFRGFGMVEQTDSEHFENWAKAGVANIVDKELHQEPVVSKSWFHTGAFLSREKILNQFAHEYWYEEMTRHGYSVTSAETILPDARLIAGPGLPAGYINSLSVHEWREALRSCKSMGLHSEVFALDAPLVNATDEQIKKQLTPFTSASHNCLIELLQPKGNNKHAIFVVKESESITYSYERNTDDPRVAHNLNIKLDEFGNVLESAAVVYPRAVDQIDRSLPSETQEVQSKTTIIYTKNNFTNDVFDNDIYRLRLPSEVKTYELKGISKSDSFYSVNDFVNVLTNTNEVPYHKIKEDPLICSQKRLIEHVRTNYYINDLSGALPVHQLESLALPYENYQLAYTPGLLTDIFNSKINDALMIDGKFTHSEGDANWWVRSGTIQYTETNLTYAEDHFFMPVSYTDPYGAVTKVKCDTDYLLFIKETEDALQNKSSVDLFNFRTLSPQRMRDINNNLSEVITDELGLVKALAVMGKGTEADDLTGLHEFKTTSDDAFISSFFDENKTFAYSPVDDDSNNLLQHATARFVYDFDVYQNSGKPAVVASIIREEHFQKNNNSPLQISFEYSNGLGKVAMKKVQAEPGIAKQVTINPNDTITIADFDTEAELRWLGNGRTILNNKGNPVKQYEPYFSVTHQYEDFKELVESGVTPIMYYDALGRMIKTEMPDGTFTKVEFDSWKQVIYDQNDTVIQSDWYNKRYNRLIDARLIAEGKDPAKEQAAAKKSGDHANTPTEQHFDTLARPILQIENNGTANLYNTITEHDIEGNLRSVTDARNNVVMSYKYDMLGNMVYQNSMDAGKRWLLHNIVGNPLRNWDERNHEFQFTYDILHRPVESKVINGDGETALVNIFEKIVYGETIADAEIRNLRGKPYRHFDTAGLVETPEYDFTGQPKSVKRKLFTKYKEVTNWNYPDIDTIDINQIPELEPDEFVFTTETDALGRISKQIAPDGSIITPGYNEAGLLAKESVEHFNPAITSEYIKDIDYNEKRQRNKIIYGNDVTTAFVYDKKTFRLTSLISQRSDNSLLQELHYTYDGIGNITSIDDRAIPTQFFKNMRVDSANEYTYDALYRLVKATGRENDSLMNFNNTDNWNDAPFMHQYNPGGPMAVRNYTQGYLYDEVGNIMQVSHNAGAANSWSRDYAYETVNNRLINTTVGSEKYLYPHHAKHGFINAMPHLEDVGCNFKEQIIRTIRQKRTDGGTPEATYYQYDGQGQRVRKITENQAEPGVMPTVKEERIYISGYELYKKHSGSDVGLERVSLSLMEKEHRFVMIEVRNDIDDGTEKLLERYQLHNHLGSAAIELDGSTNAIVISYEEYHPFGTTAYQAKNAGIKCAAKRYRYTGMERDEESGLEYHSARYYLPWIGRWCSCDPIGIEDGVNVYAYGGNRPIGSKDTSGKWEWPTLGEVVDTATDFVPVVGSVKDVYKGIRDGDGLQVAMGVGGLALDIVTLGGSSIVKGTAKTAIKVGVKEIAKQEVKQVVKQEVKQVVKQETKQVAKKETKQLVKQEVKQTAKQETKSSVSQGANEFLKDTRNAIESGQVAKGAPSNHIYGAFGENRGWKLSLSSGEIGLQAPGKVTARGADYITYNPKDGFIKVFDSKYSKTGKSLPKGDVFNPQKWKSEIQSSVKNYEGPHKEQIMRALNEEKFKGVYFKQKH